MLPKRDWFSVQLQLEKALVQTRFHSKYRNVPELRFHIERFLQGINFRIESLEMLIDNRHYVDCLQNLRKLNGCLATFGFSNLAQICTDLEFAVSNNMNENDLQRQLEALKDAISTLQVPKFNFYQTVSPDIYVGL